MKLDATPLGDAVRRLREGLVRHQREPVDEIVAAIPAFLEEAEHLHAELHRRLA